MAVPKAMLRLCAVLSERYITDRFLPDKAIDLLDESCAYVSIRHPELTELDRLTGQIEEKKAEIEEIESDSSPDYQLLQERKGELIHMQARFDELSAMPKTVAVEASDLAHVIEIWTGIPANKIEETEYAKLRDLEAHLKAHIIGQDEAITALSSAIKRSRVQMTKRRRPASFIFVGPTGVGKTELVKVLSAELFDSTEPLIRLDMTEYMEKHAVSRMIGSPPGYVGYDEAGQLTEKVRRRPYSVILFDEIEKAHPDVMNLLLQILDEGRIDDAQGRSVNFENTVIIMTSNVGTRQLKDFGRGVGFSALNSTDDKALSRNVIQKALNKQFSPEFLNRIDDIITFDQLDLEAILKIIELELQPLYKRISDMGYTLHITPEAQTHIAKQGYDPQFGARPLRRAIQTQLEDKIAQYVVEEKIIQGNTINVTLDGDEIKFTIEE